MNEKQSKILMATSIVITVLAVVCLVVFYRNSVVRLLSLFVGVIAIDVFFVTKRKLDHEKKLRERENANKQNGLDEVQSESESTQSVEDENSVINEENGVMNFEEPKDN